MDKVKSNPSFFIDYPSSHQLTYRYPTDNGNFTVQHIATSNSTSPQTYCFAGETLTDIGGGQ